ncbi:hypothetical protein G9A89_006683 [Geosiphon pyriformis]|nr:hypothetical protein G9A89_006683 [Geosiphon pyriformis]
MSLNSSTENATSTLNWLEGTLLVIKENLAIFPATEYSKVAELVKKYLIGTTLNLTKAFLKYQKAANAKDSLGQFFLECCYDTGMGTSQDQRKAYELYSKAAEAGNTFAQYNLAVCYLNGEGTMRNSEKAFELYSKAAKAGHVTVQNNLAVCYANRKKTTRNSEKAFELFSKAAEAGHLNAQNDLAYCYYNGEGMTKNSEKAFELFSKAAEAEHLDAKYNLAVCYANRKRTTRNSEKAFELYSKAAEAGHLYAKYNLAVCYANGERTTRNSEKVFELYSKAAKAGHLYAKYNLAVCYANGKGTMKNSEKAFELYSKAAEAGHLYAKYNLAVCYTNGKKMTRNSEKAFELYSKAPEVGHLNAQNNLASCYLNGIGTTKDSEKAFELYLKAAEAGYLKAQYNLASSFELYSKAAEAGHLGAQNSLASCYLNGIGITKDSEKAFELYSKAAEAGHLNAQNNLAVCYAHGEGTTRNSEKTFELYSKAAEMGNLFGQIALRAYHRYQLEITEDQEKVGNPSSQTSIGMYHRKGWEIVKYLEETFQFYLKTAEAGNQNAQYNLEWSFELYLKAAEANNLCYQNDFPDLNVHDLSLEDQDNLEYIILRFQNRGFKYSDNFQGEFLNFEAFFDQLSDEFKCFKCGNLGIIINGSPICPFCDTNKREDVFKARLPKCLECYRTLKDLLWCVFCETSRFSQIRNTWKSGNDNIDQYILYTQRNSENCRGCLEWISPDEIIYLDQVGVGEFGTVKEGRWKRGRILFWDNKIQKYERTGVTKIALKYLKNSQNIEHINSDEFISHYQSATCKYILECYGITKDITTDNYVMVLPFAEHGDLRAFLKLNEDILIWDMFFCILFQIAVVISDLGLCRPADDTPQSGKIYGVLEYLVPEIFEESSHTKYRDIYSFAIISCEIISRERPFNNTDPINMVHDVIKGKRPTIKKHTPQCIQEIIGKNWQYDPSCRDSAEKLQQKVIAARDNCHLNELVHEKRLNSEEVKGAQHDETRYKNFHLFIFNGEEFFD